MLFIVANTAFVHRNSVLMTHWCVFRSFLTKWVWIPICCLWYGQTVDRVHCLSIVSAHPQVCSVEDEAVKGHTVGGLLYTSELQEGVVLFLQNQIQSDTLDLDLPKHNRALCVLHLTFSNRQDWALCRPRAVCHFLALKTKPAEGWASRSSIWQLLFAN